MTADAAVTRDGLLDGRVTLMQPAIGYRAAIDPVLLAAGVPAAAGQRVLELGCGAGAASLCLALRVPGCRVDGLELQPAMADLARANAALNGLADRFTVHAGDLLDPPPDLTARTFDHVMMNPPFHEGGRHTRSPHPSRGVSHGEGTARLADWVQAALRRLTARGTLTLIHTADRLDDIIALLHGRFGAVTLFPLWPGAGAPAKRVLVQARRNVKSPAALLPGLVLHGPDGAFTPAAEAVLRRGEGIAALADPPAAAGKAGKRPAAPPSDPP